MKIIDINAGAGFWPAQHFSAQNLGELDTLYKATGIEEVWISAVESILFPEPDTFDFQLFAQLPDFPRFRPVKTVNPILANWQRSCMKSLSGFPVAALKLIPNYHGYSLTSDRVAEICCFAREKMLPLLMQMRVNDERNQPSYMEVRGVPAAEVAELSNRYPENRIYALSAYLHELEALAKGSQNLFVDLSFLDAADTIAAAAERIPVDRIVFGSNAPFMHIQAAALKLSHCTLQQADQNAIASGNILR